MVRSPVVAIFFATTSILSAILKKSMLTKPLRLEKCVARSEALVMNQSTTKESQQLLDPNTDTDIRNHCLYEFQHLYPIIFFVLAKLKFIDIQRHTVLLFNNCIRVKCDLILVINTVS